MRLDYTLYALAVLLLILATVFFVVKIEGIEAEGRDLLVITAAVLGVLSIGLGYYQRPKTEAQACQLASIVPQIMNL